MHLAKVYIFFSNVLFPYANYPENMQMIFSKLYSLKVLFILLHSTLVEKTF